MTNQADNNAMPGNASGVSTAPSRRVLSRRFAMTFGGLLIAWVLLTGSLQPEELVMGILISALAAFLSSGHVAMLDGIKFSLGLPVHLTRYFLTFFTALLVANLDVARRVVSPGLRIRPDVVRVKTGLQSELGKLWLANSITLTPGTLTLDVHGQELEIHWIDVSPGTDVESATREIVARFENVLKGFLK